MVIKNYIIDKKLYLEFPEEIDQKIFLQLRFICLDTKVLFSFKKILLSIDFFKKIFNFDYVNSFKNDKSDNILIANKLIEGLNKNEINCRKIEKTIFLKNF